MNHGVSDGSRPLTVFVHVPRTAGTAFGYALRAAYGDDRVRRLGNVFKGGGGTDHGRFERARRRRQLPPPGCDVLTGHVPFGMLRDAMPPGARYVTVLRDPVARTLSHYRTVLAARTYDYMAVHRPVAELLAEGIYLQPNLQTRMLCDNPEPFGEPSGDLLEQAKANLAAFAGFGLTERFDESLALLGRRLGVVFRQPPAKRSRGPAAPAPNTKALRAIRRANELDAELYRWACDHFDRMSLELQETARA